MKNMIERITPKATWKDISFLKDDQRKVLLNIIKTDRHKGLTVLFSGPSGTGKTMAAQVIANDMKLDLYKIDLSSVVSKYIGETEKNLSKVFEEAESSNAILYFYEADALFGRRTEVKDAHDSYANIEISYLLQRMEEYQGISILASNLKDNIDEAFPRRFKFIVHFPIPDTSPRVNIWKKFWSYNDQLIMLIKKYIFRI